MKNANYKKIVSSFTCMPLLLTTGKRSHAAVYQIPILLLKL